MIKKRLALSETSTVSSVEPRSESKGFTLVELLVVIAVLSLLGVLVLVIFTSSLRGSNKSQILLSIKQNGQSVLEQMDKTVRNADRVVCASNLSMPGPTLVIVKNSVYTRYRFTAPTNTANGYLQQETFNLPSTPPVGADPNLFIRDFEKTVCINPSENAQKITDNNPQTGVSIYKDPNQDLFTRNRSSGFKDQVTIKFIVKPGVQAPAAVAGQIDPVTFQTTIQLR